MKRLVPEKQRRADAPKLIFLGMISVKKNLLLVKNMVCHRCVLSVEEILRRNDISFHTVMLGEVELAATLDAEKRAHLKQDLAAIGFELIESRIIQIVEAIKLRVVEYVNLGEEKTMNLSAFITDTIHYDYSYLSDLFSSIEGMTIEQFFILQRIEKVKELLVYQQLSLSDIAFKTGFSSTAHLSTQFKKATGLTPSYFKKIGAAKRKSADNVG